MAAIAFTDWLNSAQDFAAGLALYAQHPDARPALLQLMRRSGAGPFTSKKLTEEITRLSAAAPPAEEEARAPGAQHVHVPATTPGAALPEEVQQLIDERIRLFKEGQHLRSQLLLLPTDADRYKAACTIKSHFRRIDEIWSMLEYRDKHGALPPEVVHVASDDDPLAQRKRLTTLRTYISSKRGTPEKRAAWEAELAQLERKLAV